MTSLDLYCDTSSLNYQELEIAVVFGSMPLVPSHFGLNMAFRPTDIERDLAGHCPHTTGRVLYIASSKTHQCRPFEERELGMTDSRERDGSRRKSSFVPLVSCTAPGHSGLRPF